MNAIKQTEFLFPGQTGFYRGKVRDVYFIGEVMVMVATDRISAFDYILPEAIPDKGRVLNLIAAKNLEATSDIVPNWVVDVADDNATIGWVCAAFAVEMVIRGYLSGHAWREYRDGKRTICGVALPEGLSENDPLPAPIITPTTKASEGHDEDISREEIISKGLVSEADYVQLENFTRKLFERGTSLASQRDLILVDTKYEFGKRGDQIYLIDEVHTPDSSRYFYKEGYTERQSKKEPQKQLSKEFVRQWLISEGFQGKEGQKMPDMSTSVVSSIRARYVELFEQFTGTTLKTPPSGSVTDRIRENVINSLNKINFKA